MPLGDGSLLAAATPRYHVSLAGPKGFLNLAPIADGQLLDEQIYKGSVDRGDLFGWALTTGEFDASSFAELTVGIPAQDHSDLVPVAGAVHVLCGG